MCWYSTVIANFALALVHNCILWTVDAAMPNTNLSPSKEEVAATAGASSALNGAAFVTPHKSRTVESSMSSTNNTPTPARYLPLLREIQDVQEMTAESLNTSKAVIGMATQGVARSTAAKVEASPTTMTSSFSFGVFWTQEQ